MSKLIYSGQRIKTTVFFWHFPYCGRILYENPDGSIAARITPEGFRECYSLNLRPNQWEFYEPEPGLHEDCYERSLFDD